MRHASDEQLGRYFDCRKGPRHDDKLDEETSRGVDELRKKGREEQ
jgi:hypothetical protein